MGARSGSGSTFDMQAARRRWLAQAGALASSTALPLWVPRAGAQSPSTLNALPRIGLVIGNTDYAQAPLKNSVNDAKAISAELQKLGFKVNLQLNAGRAQMVSAIQSFSGDLAKSKGVGLFYYAGHGAQLAWRNYLIPVGVAIDRLDDMREKAVELNSLLRGLVASSNPMNVIILDACRDNPFGNKVLVEQKGLSQFDAPPGSILAYATAPGNTAADGEGSNGLYTENLLRELQTPEAKIEDVFKRVRLNVRRRSAGRQIPWESTSLEEDFYFLPPEQVRKLSEAELTRQFEEELAIWEKIKESTDPGPLEDYLRRYPSGQFSELAQFRLDKALALQGEKKIETASAVDNPFTKGTSLARTDYKLGDSYTYRVIDLKTKAEREVITETVTTIANNEVVFSDGSTYDFLGNVLKNRRGQTFTGNQKYVSEYSIGKKWATRYRGTRLDLVTMDERDHEYKVVGKEQITTLAGTFDAYKVEGGGVTLGAGAKSSHKYWIAPEKVRRVIAYEEVILNRNGRVVVAERHELISYKQG